MKSSSGDIFRLKHISEAIGEIEQIIQDLRFKEFAGSILHGNAAARLLEIIGEASNHLSAELKNKYPEVNWRSITDLRNLIIHEYFGVDYSIIWNITHEQIPIFKEQIIQIIKEHN